MTKLKDFNEFYMLTPLSTLLSLSSVNPDINKSEFTLKIPIMHENDIDIGTNIALKLLQVIEIICPSLYAHNNSGYQINIAKKEDTMPAKKEPLLYS